METRRWGGYQSDKGMMGDNFFVAPNPDYGVIFRYYLRDGLKTAKAKRQASEKKLQKDGKDTPYPSWDDLQAEVDEEAPSVWMQVSDANGEVIRRVPVSTSKGLHRVAWDFRLESRNPIELQKSEGSPWGNPPQAPLATTGDYQVQLMKRHNGVLSALSQPQRFKLTELNTGVFTTKDRPALLAFQQQTAELNAKVVAAGKYLGELNSRLSHVLKAIDATPAVGESQAQQARSLQAELRNAKRLLNGDSLKTGANEKAPIGLAQRIGFIIGSHWDAQAAPMGTHRSTYQIAEKQYRQLAAMLKASEQKLDGLESALDKADAPWTPGRPL
ncbi:MAG: hypothetical protein OIF34_05475, partial [Porticoccaceae bacterium]|nr:hypothetical protein [Porticoccaceae bacterium]